MSQKKKADRRNGGGEQDDAEDWLNAEDGEEDKTDKPALPREIINDLQHDIRTMNRYKLEDSSTRNVMILGKSRSGKSTLIGVLKDPAYEAEAISLFADNAGARFQSFSLGDLKDPSKNFIINIIDTPGLHEQTHPADVERTDESILKSIAFCLKNEITKIHMLVICVSVFQGLAKEEVDVFSQYIKSFYHDLVPIVICVTRAEAKTEKEKARIIADFEKHPYFGPLLKRPNVSVEFMGCVDESILTTATDEEHLKKLYQTVYRQRTKLLSAAFKADKAIPLVELPAAHEPARQAAAELDEQVKRLDSLNDCKDFQTQTAKMLAREVMKSNTKLRDMDVISLLGKDEEVLVKMKKIKKTMSEVSKKMPENMQKIFSQGRLVEDQL